MALEVGEKILSIYSHDRFAGLILILELFALIHGGLLAQLCFDEQLLRLVLEGQVGGVSPISHKVRFRLFPLLHVLFQRVPRFLRCLLQSVLGL